MCTLSSWNKASNIVDTLDVYRTALGLMFTCPCARLLFWLPLCVICSWPLQFWRSAIPAGSSACAQLWNLPSVLQPCLEFYVCEVHWLPLTLPRWLGHVCVCACVCELIELSPAQPRLFPDCRPQKHDRDYWSPSEPATGGRKMVKDEFFAAGERNLFRGFYLR